MKKVKNAWPLFAWMVAMVAAFASHAGAEELITEVWRKNASTPCQASTCKLAGNTPCPSNYNYFSEAGCPANRAVAAFEP